jgi:hypothetical protein
LGSKAAAEKRRPFAKAAQDKQALQKRAGLLTAGRFRMTMCMSCEV